MYLLPGGWTIGHEGVDIGRGYLPTANRQMNRTA